MKTILLSSLLLLFSGGIHAQSEGVVYCLDGPFPDSVWIEQVAEELHDDTLIRTFHDHYNTSDIDGNLNEDFTYFTINDSIFIQYEDAFYLVGCNQAQVGDIWHPLRFIWNSYVEADAGCSGLMNLEVVSIQQVILGADTLNYYGLDDLDFDYWGEETWDFSFLEGYGALGGGPFYNFHSMWCSGEAWDVLYPFLKYYYQNDTLQFVVLDTCPDVVGLKENEYTTPTIRLENGHLAIGNVPAGTETCIVDLSGRTIIRTAETVIDCSSLFGLYIINIFCQEGPYAERIYFFN